MKENGAKKTQRQRFRHSGDPGNILILIYMAAVIFFLLLGTFSQAKAVVDEDLAHPRQGELLMRSDQQDSYHKAPMLSQRVAIDISGMVATAHLTQTFRNESDMWIEAVYVFPLPDEAAVTGMKMRVGERVIVGQVKEKNEARQTYIKARQEGKKTSLLAQKRPNIFSMAVANIPPQSTIEVELDFLDTVGFDQSVFSYRFPMVVGPRYIPGTPLPNRERPVSFDEGGWAADTGQVEDASQITPPVTQPGKAPLNPVELSLSLAPGFPVEGVTSLYHGVQSEKRQDGSYRLTFDGTVYADRDFVLEYRPAGREITAAFFTEKVDKYHYGYLVISPPSLPAKSMVAREIIFVVDISGSMAGSSILQAKEALQQAIKRLDNRDRFNIIVFNNTAHRLYPGSLAATERNRLKALADIDSLEADGGTEIAPALRLALNGEMESSRLKQVVFLTDGAVGNERSLFSMIRERIGDARLFTVGIGSAPNTFFMTRAALLGRGSYTFIGKVDEVADKMAQLFTKLEHPVVTDLSLTGEDGANVEMHPQPIADLYAGKPLTVVLRSDRPFGKMELAGRVDGASWQTAIDGSGSKNRPGIATLWARKKIRTLMDALHLGAAETEVRKQVVDVALRHQLVSRYTSLVAVEEKAARPDYEMLDRQQMETNLPNGWQHAKVFGTSARTATNAGLNILVGIILMISALYIWRPWLRRVT